MAHAGYRTAWVGKWHLHTGNWPSNWAPDWVPEGRDRLGFQFWRGYNMHMVYFDGFVNKGDWEFERWEGYETDALNRYGFEFMDGVGRRPLLPLSLAAPAALYAAPVCARGTTMTGCRR